MYNLFLFVYFSNTWPNNLLVSYWKIKIFEINHFTPKKIIASLLPTITSPRYVRVTIEVASKLRFFNPEFLVHVYIVYESRLSKKYFTPVTFMLQVSFLESRFSRLVFRDSFFERVFPNETRFPNEFRFTKNSIFERVSFEERLLGRLSAHFIEMIFIEVI